MQETQAASERAGSQRELLRPIDERQGARGLHPFEM